MKFWKCEFCKHDVGPYHHDANACLRDFQFYAMHCDDFELKDRMGVLEMSEWHKHEDLEHFIDRLGLEIYDWQRTILHYLVSKRPLYFTPARKSNFTTDLLPYIVMLDLFDEYEKGDKTDG